MFSISSVRPLYSYKCSVSFSKKEEKKEEKTSDSLSSSSLPLYPYLLNIKAWANRPKVLPEIIQKTPKKFEYDFHSYEPSCFLDKVVQYRYIKKGSKVKFRNHLNAEKLPIAKTIAPQVYDIDNFSHPYGTIAIPSTFDETVVTSGLLQCVGIAIVDKKQNLQTLIHYCPTIDSNSNEKLLNYILSASNLEDVEISLVNGRDDKTDNTLADVMQKLENYQKSSNSKFKSINFRYFPSDKYSVLVLHNGELSCSSSMKVDKFFTNPENKIIYASLDTSKISQFDF